MGGLHSRSAKKAGKVSSASPKKAVVDGAEIFLRGGEVGTPFRDGFLPALATFDHLFE